ncbi:MAG TPA: hypothetical protein VE690_17605 [Rhodopila sp.]|nr:hypothetical protein [Rhodopila sp.]
MIEQGLVPAKPVVNARMAKSNCCTAPLPDYMTCNDTTRFGHLQSTFLDLGYTLMFISSSPFCDRGGRIRASVFTTTAVLRRWPAALG